MSKSASSSSVKKSAPVKVALPPLLAKKVLLAGPQKQVFIVQGHSKEIDSNATELDDLNTVQCVALKHPKYDKPTRYLYSSESIWEVQRVYQPPSSWIMNHEIQQDGSFYLCTKIDPLFLALPLLERGRKKTADHEGYFLQLDQLLPKSEFPTALIRSGNMLGSKHSIGTLCDVRDGWNEQVVRLNDAKVIAWLRSKVERMRHAFKKVESLKHHYTSHELNETPEMEKERIEAERKKKEEESKTDQEEKKESPSNDTTSSTPASSPSTSSSPLSSSSSSTSSSVVSHPTFSAVKQSLAFLSEYLSPATFQLLLDSYALKLDDVFEKKRPIRRDWNENGKISNDIEISRGSSNLNGSETKRKPDKPMSATAKKLATAAKGTKSLAAFFTKKA